MKYNMSDYKPTSEYRDMKRLEKTIAEKIMTLLNKNKYDNLEAFISKNRNFQDFCKNNNLSNVMKHFRHFKEKDYIKILENLRDITKRKQEYEDKNIKTTTIDNNEYNVFEGKDKTYIIDNSNTNKTIKEQMDNLKTKGQSFQTTDTKQNTENMFNILEQKKETVNPRYLHELNYESLSENEKELVQIAQNFDNADNQVRIDLKRGLIVNKNNEIFKIQKTNGEFYVIGQNNNQQLEKEEKPKQKTLTPSKDTLYSN